MHRKFALPIGFAVVVVLAVVGVLSALGGFSFTAAQPSEASNIPAGALTLDEINAEGFNPLVATTLFQGSLPWLLSPTSQAQWPATS